MRSLTKIVAAILAAGVSFSAPAYAVGTQENRAALYAEIAAQLASGQTPPISAAQVRTVLNDIVASVYAIFEDGYIAMDHASLSLGVPTGGDEGLGTINVSGGYYINGVAVTGAGTVTSVTCGNGLTGGTITTSGTCTIDTATNGNVWGGVANKVIDAHVAQTSIAPVALVISTSTFTPAFGNGINEEITLVHAACPCTIADPTGVYAGLLEQQFSEKNQQNIPGENQWGGAKFIAGIMGNPIQRQTLEAGLAALPHKPDIGPLAEALQATGTRYPLGSPTSFNDQTFMHELTKGRPVGSVVSTVASPGDWLTKARDLYQRWNLGSNQMEIAKALLDPNFFDKLRTARAQTPGIIQQLLNIGSSAGITPPVLPAVARYSSGQAQ